MKKRICANGKIQWGLFWGSALVGLVLIVSDSITTMFWQKALYLAIFIYISACFFFRLTHSIYLCDAGIEYYRFGKLERTLSWGDVSQVCTIKLFPLSMKVSAPTFILIVPVGCKKYNRSVCTAWRYLMRFSDRVFRIDDSPQNRKFIIQLFGELDVQT